MGNENELIRFELFICNYKEFILEFQAMFEYKFQEQN